MPQSSPPIREKITLESAYIHRIQYRHFILFDIAPPIISAALIFLSLKGLLPFGAFEILLLFTFWLITGIGITVGYHRHFTHRSFKASTALRNFLVISGAMAAQGNVISWVALHRLHHERSDQIGDPHSPNTFGQGFKNRVKGLMHAHFTWMAKHAYPNVVRYAPDLLRDKELQRVGRNYYWWIFIGLAIPTIAAGIYHKSIIGAFSGFLWGGALRIFLLGNIIWSINSILHVFGSRHYETKDNSRNSGALSLITLGESWHNNHHRFPNSPSFGLKWYRLDPGYWFILLMERLGLATDLRLPNRHAHNPIK